jgi:hypothetical protein
MKRRGWWWSTQADSRDTPGVAPSVLAIQGCLAKLDDLVNFLSSQSGTTVGGGRLQALCSGVSASWADTRSDAERWGISNGTTLNGLSIHVDAISQGGRRRQRLPLLEATRSVRQDFVDGLYDAWADSVWAEFGNGYSYLTPDERDVADEAFRAYEAGCYRAAVVLFWCAAGNRMRDHIENHLTFAAYNGSSAAVYQSQHQLYRRFSRDYPVSGRPELDEVPDAHILAVLLYSQVLVSNAYQILDQVRVTRNLCAHGGHTPIGARRCAASFEDCLNNLFVVVPA